MTADFFPDWNGLVGGVGLNELWPEGDPDTTSNDVFDRIGEIRSVHDVEIYKLVEVVRAKQPSGAFRFSRARGTGAA